METHIPASKPFPTKKREGKALNPVIFIWGAGLAVFVLTYISVYAFLDWNEAEKNRTVLASLWVKAAAPAPVQSSEAPVKIQRGALDRTGVNTDVKCAECGVIESLREMNLTGEGVGPETGDGSMAGSEIRNLAKPTRSYAITVRFEDGSRQGFNGATMPPWHAGNKIKVLNGVIQSDSERTDGLDRYHGSTARTASTMGGAAVIGNQVATDQR